MSTSHQRRTAARAPAAPAAADQEAAREPEVLEEGQEVDAEKAARLQGALGNSSVAGLVAPRAGAAGQAAVEAGPEEATLEPVTETALPAVLDGPAPQHDPPWAAARFFGGSGGGGGPPAAPPPAERWRPRPVPRDPDRPPASADAPDPDDPPPVDLTEAREALGDAPVPLTLLDRGLRWPERLAHPALTAEWLAQVETPLVRARAGLRFLARHADAPEARAAAALALAAGEALAPEPSGLAGTLARALAALELALAATGDPPAWERLVLVALDPAARPRAEFAAGGGGSALSAPRLFLRGAGLEAVDPEPPAPAPAHPAARAALRRAAGHVPLVPVGEQVRAALDPLEAADRVLAAFTGGPPPSLGPVLDALNALLSAFGEIEVEGAAAGLAVEPWVPAGEVVGALVALDAACRDGARRLVPLGRAVEAAGDAVAAEPFLPGVEAIRRDVAAARDRAMEALTAPLGPPTTRGPDLPAAAVVPRVAAGDWSEAGRLAGHHPALDALLASVRGGRALARGEPLPAPVATPGPFALADRAILEARHRHARGEAWRAPLRHAGGTLRDRGEGGALRLLLAAWGEMAAG